MSAVAFLSHLARFLNASILVHSSDTLRLEKRGLSSIPLFTSILTHESSSHCWRNYKHVAIRLHNVSQTDVLHSIYKLRRDNLQMASQDAPPLLFRRHHDRLWLDRRQSKVKVKLRCSFCPVSPLSPSHSTGQGRD